MPEPAELSRLRSILDGAMAPLEGVVAKRLFGCDGYFVGGNIFAMVWKEGRLGLRFLAAASLAEAHALPGSAACEMGSRRMQAWVLLPVAFHADRVLLRRWARRAYQEACARPERTAVTGKRKGPAKVVPAQFRRLHRGEL